MSMIVAVGTESELKKRGVAAGFYSLGIDVNITGCNASSGIANQPRGYETIKRGVCNRIEEATRSCPNADYHVGIESGMVYIGTSWYDVIGVGVLHKGEFSMTYSATYELPDWLVEYVERENTEIGHVVQELAKDIKEKDGYLYFSENRIARDEVIRDTIKFALMRFVAPERFAPPKSWQT